MAYHFKNAAGRPISFLDANGDRQVAEAVLTVYSAIGAGPGGVARDEATQDEQYSDGATWQTPSTGDTVTRIALFDAVADCAVYNATLATFVDNSGDGIQNRLITFTFSGFSPTALDFEHLGPNGSNTAGESPVAPWVMVHYRAATTTAAAVAAILGGVWFDNAGTPAALTGGGSVAMADDDDANVVVLAPGQSKRVQFPAGAAAAYAVAISTGAPGDAVSALVVTATT